MVVEERSEGEGRRGGGCIISKGWGGELESGGGGDDKGGVEGVLEVEGVNKRV